MDTNGSEIDEEKCPPPRKKKASAAKKATDMNLCGTIGHMPTAASGFSSFGSIPPISPISPKVSTSSTRVIQCAYQPPAVSPSQGDSTSTTELAATPDSTAAAAAGPVTKASPIQGDIPDDETLPHAKCCLCDPTSTVEHSMKTTRIRIANLCCSGEESIIMNILNPFKGIDSIKTNLIGRYAVVTHCPEYCCAPAVKMVEKLCEARLGASIQEAGDGQGQDAESNGPALWKLLHAVIVTLIFIAAIVADVHYGDESTSFWIYLFNVLVGSAPIVKRAMETIFVQRALNIQVLMLVAIGGAMGAGDFHDAGIVVTLFIIAELLEDYVMSVVRKAISNTARGLVKTATLAEDGKQVPIDSLKIGEIIAVRAGDMIPVDGEVHGGQGVVDESALTGEATPVAKLIGSKVVSGTVVQNGYIEVSVTVEPENSTLRRMNQAVEDVQADRGKFATMVDQFAGYWTPSVLIVAILFLLIGGGASGEWAVYLHRTLVLLVLACPCAVVLAAPIACVCAIAGAAKHGILIKGSSVVEKLGLINVVAVDKTGTLTKGFFSLIESISLVTPDVRKQSKAPRYNALQLAAALESKSAHPLANAIVAGYCGCIADLDADSLPTVEEVKVLDGIGLEGFATLSDGNLVRVCVGNERLFNVNGGPCSLSEQQISVLDSFAEKYKSATIVIVAIEDELQLAIALGDTIRPEAHMFCSSLNYMACSVAMLTGDHKDVATETCKVLKISECEARMLPEGKYEWVKNKVSQGENVMMLGDGINDATALAMATVGVAMGAGGAAMAVEVADMVLMSENLLRIPATIQLGQLARVIVLENIAFSIAMKLVAVILAFSGHLDLWHAVLFDIGSVLVVIANGIRPLYSEQLFESYSLPTAKHQKETRKVRDVESQKIALLSSEMRPFNEHALPRASVRAKARFVGHDIDGYRASSFSSLLITEETGVVDIIAEQESLLRGPTGYYGRPGGRQVFSVEL